MRGLARGYPRHVIALSLACGLALGAAAPWLQVASALLLLLVVLCLGGRAEVAIAACVIAVIGGVAGQARLASIDSDPLAESGASGRVTVNGDLVRHSRSGERTTTYRLRIKLPGGARQLIEAQVFGPAKYDLRIGSEVTASGRVQAVDQGLSEDPATARYARMLLREGVRQRLLGASVAPTGERRGGAYGAIDSIRTRSEIALARALPAEAAALLRGMVLGGDDGIPEQTVESFRVSGLAHILAVSGQNVLLIVILVRAIAVALGAGRRLRLVVPAALIAIYVPLCGGQASVLRAGVMGLAGLAAISASRPASRVYAAILAAIAVLAWNPRFVADVGAQLSFAAVFGIMAFTRPISAWLTARVAWLPSWAAEALAATAGATLSTAPLMALHFQRFSMVSLLANVLATPLIGMIVWLGSLSAALGQVSASLASVLNVPNSFLLGSLIELARLSASIPGAEVSAGGVGYAILLVLYGGLIVLAALANRWLAWPSWLGEAASTIAKRPAVASVGIGLMLAIAIAFAGNDDTLVRRPSVVMLDVGQGDAMLVRGSAGCDALVDTGPDPSQLKRRLDEHGAGRLDLLVVTHSHDDHYGGIESLIGNRRSPRLVLDGGGGLTTPTHRALIARLRAGGSRIEAATAGTTWRCGDVSFSVKSPASPPSDGDPNDGSVVAQIEVGRLSVLATGDAESPVLSRLPLAGSDVLKVPHHGSADPGLAGLLERVRPRVAIIGVGRANRHGHPAPATIEQLAAAGITTYRTDRDGSITVSPRGRSELAVYIAGADR